MISVSVILIWKSFVGDSSSSSDEDVTLPPARRGRGRGVRANRGRGRGRGQTRAGRGQPRPGPGPGGDADECQWSFDLVDPPGIRYVNAANVGVTDSDERRGLSPLGLFSLFFTDYLMREIAVETNRYADQVMARPPRMGLPICRGRQSLYLSCEHGSAYSSPWVL